MSASVAAVVLAAGFSRRFGPENKLLVQVDDKALVAHPVDALLESGLAPVIVVTGHDRLAVESALSGRDVAFVHNRDYDQGMGGSIAVGIGALRDVRAVLIVLGDMPDLGSVHVRALLASFDPSDEEAILVPMFRGRPGHPVLFGRSYFGALRELQGDRGARSIVTAHEHAVVAVEVADAGVNRDIDHPTDL